MTEGYAADWTTEQLRDAAQCVADRIDELIRAGVPTWEAGSRAENVVPGYGDLMPADSTAGLGPKLQVPRTLSLIARFPDRPPSRSLRSPGAA